MSGKELTNVAICLRHSIEGEVEHALRRKEG
jgi:hypothetical protein